MNVEKLRKSYDKLTPFERAALTIKEATGRQRESEIAALAPNTIADGYQLTEWQLTFLTVASYAMFRASDTEKSFFAYAYLAEHGGREVPPLDKAGEVRDSAAGWLAALKRLADDTGAPLIETAKLLDREFPDKMLAYAEKWHIDGGEQYEILRRLWLAYDKQGERLA